MLAIEADARGGRHAAHEETHEERVVLTYSPKWKDTSPTDRAKQN